MFFTGIQYDPVLSITTLVQPSWMSHCLSFSSSGTVVPNNRAVTSPSLSAGPTTRATASSLLPTSIPAHRSITAGISITILLLCCEASSRRIVYTLPLGPLQAPLRGPYPPAGPGCQAGFLLSRRIFGLRSSAARFYPWITAIFIHWGGPLSRAGEVVMQISHFIIRKRCRKILRGLLACAEHAQIIH